FPQSPEVDGLELREIEPRLPIERVPRSGPEPRERRRAMDEVLPQGPVRVRVPESGVPGPETDEVVAVTVEEVEVGLEVERLGRGGPAHVDEGVPRGGAREVDGPQRARRRLRAAREVARGFGMD